MPLLLPLKNKNITSLILILIFGIGLGLWRGSIYMHKLYELKTLSGQKVTIEATASNDAIYYKQSQLEFTVSKVQLSDPYKKSLSGSFKIRGFGVPMVYRGDRVEVSGKIYPTRGSNQAIISYAQLTRVQASSNWLNNLSRKFATGMQNSLPEPMASFGLGLLIGQRTTMPKNILDQLTAVGLVHIVAVSGYNLTILVRAVSRLKLGSKYQQLILSLMLIGLFITVTGFSASIVRAAVVSTLGLWAWYYGRQIRPIVIISFAAALTGLFSPFYVWSDLGWYLSFLAFFGVMIIAPIISARIFSRPPKLLTTVLIETLSAELMTLPLILTTFNQLSLVALLANTLVVPLVPVAMLLAVVAAIAGAWLTPIAGWFALPGNILLTYMLDIVHLLASIPSVLIKASLSYQYMIILYGLILLVIFSMRRRLRTKLAQE